MLGDWLSHSDLYGKDAIGLMIRRERTQLMETWERARSLFTLLGAKFHDQEKYCRMPNGARLRFAYLERDADADAYQGHSYTRVYPEELGTFPDSKPIMKLMATLRSGVGVPCGFRATGNPGGPGHTWVKSRYIDPAPMGWKLIPTEFKNPFTGEITVKQRVFIPSRLTDNRYLGSEYVANLQMSGSPELVRAWLEGDWSAIEGAFFPEFTIAKHVLRPFEIPKGWTRFRALDWGSASPFSVGWYAIANEQLVAGGQTIPRGALVRYREWYGASQPNVGLKLTAEELAAGILERDNGDEITYSVADPSAFSEDGGPSIMERVERAGCRGWRYGDNRRVARLGAVGGWDQVRARLKGDGERPALFLFNTSTNLIRTLPALQHDTDKPEDLDTESEDHAADELRYACMSRPYAKPLPVAPQPPKPGVYADEHGNMKSTISIKRWTETRERERESDE
jgi:hypothetical protein